MKVILMHGKDTDPSKKWYPWLSKEMKKLGVKFLAPTLPNPSNPSFDEWIRELEKANPDQDTILIGHSRGGVTILRWLERLPLNEKVRKVILIAANSGHLKKIDRTDKVNGFFTEQGYNFEKIKSHCDNFVILHSRDDEWVSFEAGEENARGLNAKFLRFNDRGHFGKKINAVPELLNEIN